MKRYTFQNLKDLRNDWESAVIVFSSSNWDEEYSLEERSYRINSGDKYFDPEMIGNSLYGHSLDGSDKFVRLDHYLDGWKIEYCYITKMKE